MSDLSRSHVSRHKIRLVLNNRSEQSVRVVWRDYAGGAQEHAVLQEGNRTEP